MLETTGSPVWFIVILGAELLYVVGGVLARYILRRYPSGDVDPRWRNWYRRYPDPHDLLDDVIVLTWPLWVVGAMGAVPFVLLMRILPEEDPRRRKA